MGGLKQRLVGQRCEGKARRFAGWRAALHDEAFEDLFLVPLEWLG